MNLYPATFVWLTYIHTCCQLHIKLDTRKSQVQYQVWMLKGVSFCTNAQQISILVYLKREKCLHREAYQKTQIKRDNLK